MKGWNVASKPSSTPMPRAATWKRMCAPEAFAFSARATIFFRLILDLPAYLVTIALANAIATAAFLGWFAALFTGRMPRGLRNVIAWGLRYSAQFYSYGFLLTERYPYTGPGPLQRAPAEAPPEPAPPVPEAV